MQNLVNRNKNSLFKKRHYVAVINNIADYLTRYFGYKRKPYLFESTNEKGDVMIICRGRKKGSYGIFYDYMQFKDVFGHLDFDGQELQENLPSVAVQQGATVAIGFEDEIDCKKANKWLTDIFEMLKNGYSIGYACAYFADPENTDYYIGTGLDTVIVYGDGTVLYYDNGGLADDGVFTLEEIPSYAHLLN